MKISFRVLVKYLLIILVSFFIGSSIGYKFPNFMIQLFTSKDSTLESSIFDKDELLTNIPRINLLKQKKLIQVKRKANNIILLIGDGMGTAQISTFRMLRGGPNDRVSVDHFPVTGFVLTHSSNAIITDSASSATAYSTGKKTNNGVLGLDKDQKFIENITEKIHKYGFVNSLISTSDITHATPAAFVSHVESRSNSDEISKQILESNIMTILGGGRHFFTPKEEGGLRKDNINLLDSAKLSHILLTQRSELESFDFASKEKVIGLFADRHLRDVENIDNHALEPSLREMLNFAITRSSQHNKDGCKGFFIMAEGSQVDWAGHANDINYLKKEMHDFDQAVQLALDYAKDNQNTLVVVTADHETGGLLIEPEFLKNYLTPQVKFSFNTGIGYGSHTGVPVPIYAYGPGSENFTGTLDNTDVYYAMLEALDIGNEERNCVD